MLHTNVGLSNGAIGAINAATDHVPMLLMSGRTPTVERNRFGARTVPIGWGQEMRDQAALVREACKWDYELRFPEQVPQLLDRAHAIATSTPKGPVYLSLPREVLCEPCPLDELETPPSMAAADIVAPPDVLRHAARLLAAAERPVIFAQRGAGAQDGFDALATLADNWSIPVCQYWAVATAISAHHPMYVGQDPEPWISEADVVLVVDSLAPWSPDIHRLDPGCQVIQLGPNPLYSRFPVRNFRSDLSITTEVGPGLVGLEHALRELAGENLWGNQQKGVIGRNDTRGKHHLE
jgi:acetolactate synthase-1/2/3 large subunit